MLVATFGTTTAWAGKRIEYENERFVLEGHQPAISAQDVLKYDAQGHLTWASDDMRAWVEQVAAVAASTAAPASGRVGVAGFVLSLVGLVFPLLFIVGLILSLGARKQAKEQNRPGGLALAGIIISVVGLAFLVLSVGGFLIVGSSGVLNGCTAFSSAQEDVTQQLDRKIARDEAAVKADPKDAAAWASLGDSYLDRANTQPQGSEAQKADWRQAARAYESADALLAEGGTAAKQQRLDVLEKLINAHLFLQDYQSATSVYGEITGLRPKDAQSYFDWASLAINAGDTDTALLAFTRFLELDPQSPDAPAVKDWIEQNSVTPAASPQP